MDGVLRTYTGVYSCGTVISHQQSIVRDDTDAPTFTFFPADEVHSCDFEVGESIMPEALDNCSIEPIVSMDEVITGIGCDRVIERQFTVTDECGNATTQSQFITFDASLVGVQEFGLSNIDVLSASAESIILQIPTSLVRGDCTARLIDARGRVIQVLPLTQELRLNGSLTQGVYLLSIVTGADKRVIRLRL